MTADDFRRLALSLHGADESSHMGAADFRVGGRIFATLAHLAQGYGKNGKAARLPRAKAGAGLAL